MYDILVYRVHTLLHLRTVCIQWIRHSKNFWALNEIDSHVLTSRNQPRKRASVSNPKIDTQKNRLNLELAGGDILHSCICIPRVHFFAACLQKNLLRKTTQLSLMVVIFSPLGFCECGKEEFSPLMAHCQGFMYPVWLWLTSAVASMAEWSCCCSRFYGLAFHGPSSIRE